MAFDIKKHFDVDGKLATEGVWESLGGDAAVLVARSGNPNFTKEYRLIPAAIRKMISEGRTDDEQSAAIMAKLMAKTILLDWKNLTLDGKKLQYSKEVAEKVLLDYPDFRQFIWEVAEDAKRFYRQERETDLKNSGNVSSGN